MATGTWWFEAGFAEQPDLVVAQGHEILYRVSGGSKSLVWGSFFTPLKVDRVSAAELSYNIVTWENLCRAVATFRVKPGVQMWVGKVRHGEKDIADRRAMQVFIRNPSISVDLLAVETLKQDLFVSPLPGHA